MKLPKFETEAEEREFWENQTIAGYWKDLQESDDTFKRPNVTPVTLKLDPLVLAKIRMLSRKRGIPRNAYIRYLLARGVEEEINFKRSRKK